MFLLGIDLGTSSVKVSVIDANTRSCVTSVQYPETEADIISSQPGWAEQRPELWWEYTQQAILKCNASGLYNSKEIKAIGIAYQMHGLVLVNNKKDVLRNAIIWCDSRAVTTGEKAFAELGEDHCLHHLLNSPGNFTASKLAWVKRYEPELYQQVDHVLLPGDFIAMKLTGEMTTTPSALSEGIFWDFPAHGLSPELMSYFEFDRDLIPGIQPVFSTHGIVTDKVAGLLALKPGIPVTYKAGDQLNNAFTLNVSEPGEVAATAGTSGVIYGVTDQLFYDQQSRINSFAHVNHTKDAHRIGVLLCINGAGIFYRWIKNRIGADLSYEQLNTQAAHVSAGSDGLFMLPFGNGAERMLNNKTIGAHIHGLDFNKHSSAHIVHAAQEGIAFAFRYGLDIMRDNKLTPTIIRAGHANMFLSPVFVQSFVNATGVPVELYAVDGSIGAALGAGLGAGCYQDVAETFSNTRQIQVVEPAKQAMYENLYQDWKYLLDLQLNKVE